MVANWRSPADVVDQFPNSSQESLNVFVFPVINSRWSIALLVTFPEQIALVSSAESRLNIDVKVIRTEQQYHSYLEVVEALMTKSPLSKAEAEQLELLTVVLEAHENAKYPVEPPDPIEAILFRMHEKGLKQADLIPYFGTSSRVSEVLHRKRPLTVQMIRALSIGLGISADTLIGLSTPDIPGEIIRESTGRSFPSRK